MTSAVATPTAMSTSADSSEARRLESRGDGGWGEGDRDSAERNNSAISAHQVVEMLLSRLPSQGVGQLLTRLCGLGRERDELYTLLVETTAVRTQQRSVHVIDLPQCIIACVHCPSGSA